MGVNPLPDTQPPLSAVTVAIPITRMPSVVINTNLQQIWRRCVLKTLPTVHKLGLNASKAEDRVVVHALLVAVAEAERLHLMDSRETKCSS
jgi:hypothetical protein